jgi:hypothetical protein
LDPAPTWLVTDCGEILSLFLSVLVNRSLSTGCFPLLFKHAIITPILKKDNADVDVPNNYRPVSNLSFVSKLLERVVQHQLQHYLDTAGLLPHFQSAYRKGHSTETALMKIYNDTLIAADNGDMSALCMLDLSAAFDTVDHEILLNRLEIKFGIRNTALT